MSETTILSRMLEIETMRRHLAGAEYALRFSTSSGESAVWRKEGTCVRLYATTAAFRDHGLNTSDAIALADHIYATTGTESKVVCEAVEIIRDLLGDALVTEGDYPKADAFLADHTP